MRRIHYVLIVLVGISGCRHGNAAPDPDSPPFEWSGDMQIVADGNNHFALDLYAKLRDEEKGNIFFSPYSIHTALSMTATGAKGTTREQMVKALHLPVDEEKALASGDLGRFYAHPRRDFDLSVANAIWGQKGYAWQPEWLEIQSTRFGAGFQTAEFVEKSDAERERINRWVQEQTRDRIKDLLRPGQVDRGTRIVLANAIYFKGQWARQFDPKHTHEAPFYLADGTTIPTRMMSGEPECRFGSFDDVELVELPYKGNELSMVVILPKKRDALSAIEKQLNDATVGKWLGSLRSGKEWPVVLPLFRIESRFDLPPQLKGLGMLEAFQPGVADFSGMLPGGGLHIGVVAHKAYVDVNEEGTVAAAATAVTMQKVSAPMPFRADHPFLFLIRDVKHGTVLFMGRVMNPKG